LQKLQACMVIKQRHRRENARPEAKQMGSALFKSCNFTSSSLLLLSSHEHAAIDMNGGARDITGTRPYQKADSLSDVDRLAQPTQRHLLQDGGGLGLVQAAGHVGVDKTGRHAVDGNAPGTQLA